MRLFAIILSLAPVASCFQPHTTKYQQETALKANGTGGWGIGNSREMVPEEFARGDRKAFEGYNLQDRGEFMRKVKQDSQTMKDSEMEELLGVASIAGISVKDPSTRLNKFDDDLMDDDDDLDLSIDWDQDTSSTSGKEDSITRMDEDTLGIW